MQECSLHILAGQGFSFILFERTDVASAIIRPFIYARYFQAKYLVYKLNV